MLVAFGSVKGSPGTTCLTAAIGALWQRRVDGSGAERPLLVVEADPSGGVLAVRAGLPLTCGLAGLAAQSRSAGLSGLVVSRHVQMLPSGVAVLVGPVGGHQAASVLAVVAETMALFARSLRDGATVLVDAGRLDAGSSAWPLVAGADGVVLVVRADAEGLAAAAAWVSARTELEGRVAIVVRAPDAGPEFSAHEISTELGIAVLATLPSDNAAADRAVTGPAKRDLTRSSWWAAVEDVTRQVGLLRPLVPNSPVVSANGVRGLR